MEHTLSVSEAKDKFITGLKRKYKERRLNHDRKQWPPCKSEKLVRLELVETERMQNCSSIEQRGSGEGKFIKQTPLAYADLFKVDCGKRPVRKVLIEGDTGIGKTTLCTALSEDWADGKIFQEFELLLLLALREKAASSASSFLDLLSLLHPKPEVCSLVKEYFEEDEGKILIIADGWDELSKEKREEGSFLYEFLFGELYNSVSTLVTSRPSASALLHHLSCIDCFAEVHGFDKEHIVEYINSEFSSDHKSASDLLDKLENNPLVESICSVPINCAIICHLWRVLKGDLPTTMTELYTKVILNIILRNIRKFPAYETTLNLSTFDDLPESLERPWWLLCEFAFQTLQKDQLVFSDKELRDFFPQELVLGNEILCFGLLQSSLSSLEVGCGRSFHFLHLTFQEYLAALFLVKQESDSQITDSSLFISKLTTLFQMKQGCYSQRSNNSSPLSRLTALLRVKQECYSQINGGICPIILRFFFGIVYTFEMFRNNVGRRILTMLTDKHYLPYKYEMLGLCHWAFEAHNEGFVHIIANHIIRGDYQYSATLQDLAAILYVISNTSECVDMKIGLGHCNLHDSHVTALANVLAIKDGKLQVKWLDLSGNKLTDRGVTEFFYRGSAAFQTLEYLDLGGNRIGSKGIDSVLTTLCKCLEVQFLLNYNPLEVPSVMVFRDVLCSHQVHSLSELHLEGSLSTSADTNAEFILALGHCHNLRFLELSNNNLHISGGKALGKLLPLISLLVLNLSNTKLGNEGMAALTQSLNGKCQIGRLDLKSNDIHAAGVSCLADSVCAGKIVIKTLLLLSSNSLCLEGAMALIRLLGSEYFQASNVQLQRCGLTTVGGDNISVNFNKSTACVSIREWICNQGIKANIIERLHLSFISFTGESIHLLASFMYLCPQLRFLRCNNCEITSKDLKYLLYLLSQVNLNLETWNLSSNNIDNDGVYALIKQMPMFPSLIHVNVDNCDHISPGMLMDLEDVCKKRWEVCNYCSNFACAYLALPSLCYFTE